MASPPLIKSLLSALALVRYTYVPDPGPLKYFVSSSSVISFPTNRGLSQEKPEPKKECYKIVNTPLVLKYADIMFTECSNVHKDLPSNFSSGLVVTLLWLDMRLRMSAF